MERHTFLDFHWSWQDLSGAHDTPVRVVTPALVVERQARGLGVVGIIDGGALLVAQADGIAYSERVLGKRRARQQQ